MHPRVNLGYSERRNLVVKFRVRRIPIGIEVDPVGIRPEPGDSCSKPIKFHHNFSFRSKLSQGFSSLLAIVIVFYGI